MRIEKLLPRRTGLTWRFKAHPEGWGSTDIIWGCLKGNDTKDIDFMPRVSILISNKNTDHPLPAKLFFNNHDPAQMLLLPFFPLWSNSIKFRFLLELVLYLTIIFFFKDILSLYFSPSAPSSPLPYLALALTLAFSVILVSLLRTRRLHFLLIDSSIYPTNPCWALTISQVFYQ